jgi:protease PrsW
MSAAVPARKPRALRVTLIIGIALALLALDLLLMGASAGAWAFALAAVLALLPLPYFLALALWADRYEPELYRYLLLAFVWGAGVAAFLAGILNSGGQSIVAETFGEQAGDFYGGSISAPVVEESLKGVILFILWWRTSAINGVLDGIVYAMMAGLGFAFVEEIAYYAQEAVRGGFPAAFTHFIMRGLLLGLMHPVWTCLTGVGIGIAVVSGRPLVRRVAPIVGLAGAMLFHSVHNSVAGDYLAFQYFLLLPITSIVLIVVVVLSLRREAKVVREHLPPGTLSPDEIDRLFSIRGRIGGFWTALRQGGLSGLRARDEYLRTITGLAWSRYREAGPAPPVVKGPSEVEAMYRERLRHVQEASA